MLRYTVLNGPHQCKVRERKSPMERVERTYGWRLTELTRRDVTTSSTGALCTAESAVDFKVVLD